MKKNKIHLIERISTNYKYGLSSSQVEERLNYGFTNEITQKRSKSVLSIFADNVFTFFNLIEVIVTIALLLIHAAPSRFVFVFVYLMNMLIGIVQELRAKRSIDKLSFISNKKYTLIRDGKETEKLSDEIVLDDIIRLKSGDQIPTDCVVVEGEILVNESLLTGESIPVKKKIDDELLSGSFIIGGSCHARAVKVGKDNYIQILSEKAKIYKKPHSEIMDTLKFIIKIISCIILPVAALFILKAYLNNPSLFSDTEKLFSTIDMTSTVIVGMIPSGMFLLTSVALATGIIKLSAHNTLVHDLYSLEMLARTDTICFDKTGTITDGKMNVKELILLDKYDKDSINSIMGSMLFALKDDNQTANALIDYFGKNKDRKAHFILPFNSVRKMSVVSFDEGSYAFGAPEFVLDKNEYKKIEDKVNEYAYLGLRVLVLAKSTDKIKDDIAPKHLLPIALILIEDHIREDAIETIKWFKDNGVAIKVISGDNPITVSEVSKRVGIENADKYISLEGLTDQEVYNVANKYTVFGRVLPEQKAILIKSLKDAGKVTAMTGDGVNDVLALKEADCAISVAEGSDAARNIANIVLLDNNFNSMPKVVFEGRRVINNVQRSSSLYLMKTMFVMLLSIITLIIPNGEYPFNLSNMQLLELLILGVAPFFLSLQPNKDKVEGRFINYVLRKSLPSALLMILSIGIVALSRILLKDITPDVSYDVYLTLMVLSLTYSGLVNFFFICRPFNKYRTVLFSSIFSIVFIVTLIVVFNGFTFLDLNKLTPFSKTWRQLIVFPITIIVNILLHKQIEKICNRFWKVKK